MLDGGFIQNSKLLIQNFAARAECAFPRDHFLTGFTELTGLVGLGQEEIQSSVLPRSLPLILPCGLPLAGCPARARWPVFRGEARFYPAPRA
jgi:hypothetical protein